MYLLFLFAGKLVGLENALNRLKDILPVKTKEALYHVFKLSYSYYCSKVWHHCGSRNTKELERAG